VWGVVLVSIVSGWLVLQCQRRVHALRIHARVNPRHVLGAKRDQSPAALRTRLAEFEPESPEYRLLEGLVAAPDSAHAVAHLNEVTLDVEAMIEQARGWTRSAVRIAGAFAMVCALVGAAGHLGSPLGGYAWDLLSLFIGLFGAGVCGYLGREAERLIKQTREGYNALIRGLSGSLDS